MLVSTPPVPASSLPTWSGMPRPTGSPGDEPALHIVGTGHHLLGCRVHHRRRMDPRHDVPHGTMGTGLATSTPPLGERTLCTPSRLRLELSARRGSLGCARLIPGVRRTFQTIEASTRGVDGRSGREFPSIDTRSSNLHGWPGYC